MTMASRLSTAANMGELDTFEKCRPLLIANLMLMQVQAVVVGFAAALFSVLMGIVFHHEFDINHCFLLMASSTVTASLASGLLGLLMGIIIFYSLRFKINPDNVATPIAAALGDLITLAILAGFGSFLYACMKPQPWVAPLFVVIFSIGVLPTCYKRAYAHPATKNTLLTRWSWYSVGLAMVVSSLAGVILERYVSQFESEAVLSPVINGIGGNLGAVLASRISTALHAGTREPHLMASIILFLLVAPTSIIFLFLINVVGAGHTEVTPLFVFSYNMAALAQVWGTAVRSSLPIFLLYLQLILVNLTALRLQCCFRSRTSL
eukprot:m.362669 g.362669  ORF g.362669 m.362669 type:complete len:321 (+) comp56018_c0_seq15:586-1548(+)